jgi:hypothetical protein
METAFLAMALTVIKAAVKNPKKKAQLRKILLQLRDAIDAAFPDEL